MSEMVNEVMHSNAEGKCQSLMCFSILTDHSTALANFSKNKRIDNKEIVSSEHSTYTISLNHYLVTFAFTMLLSIYLLFSTDFFSIDFCTAYS